MSIEDDLRAALAPRDPGPAFTHTVLARIDADRSAAPPALARRRWQLPAAFAASLLVAVTGLGLLHAQRARQHREEAQQLQLALAITSQRLNQVQQLLHRPRHEENGT